MTTRMLGLRSAAELAAGRGHGDRLKYVAGCRCTECRAANSRYERERQRARKAGDWNGIVDAATARDHLLALKRAGVGRQAVADATDVAKSIIHEIRQGRITRIRARTERKILAVTTACRADHALVSARHTWGLVDQLLEEGYTKSGIARLLGYKGRGIQKGKRRVTVRSAHEVEVLHRRLTT